MTPLSRWVLERLPLYEKMANVLCIRIQDVTIFMNWSITAAEEQEQSSILAFVFPDNGVMRQMEQPGYVAGLRA